MNVLILGGGTVGTAVAEFLYANRHQVTIVEHDPKALARIANMDVTTVFGAASMSETLDKARVKESNLCLALTSNDEVNIIGASIAKAMGAPRSVARIYSGVYQDLRNFNYRRHFHIDRMMSIEYLTAMELARRIREPGSMMIEHFAQSQVEMREFVVMGDTKTTGVPLKELKLPNEVRIGSINRDGKISVATADAVILPGDRVTVMGNVDELEKVTKLFKTVKPSKKSAVILGGGDVGFQLAMVLQKRNYSIRILESNMDRCTFLGERLQDCTVLNSDGMLRKTLEPLRLAEVDFFIAATGDDKTNIVSCSEANELGAKSTMAVVKHRDFGGLVKRLGINEVVNPTEVVTRQVGGLLNTGPVVFASRDLIGQGILVVELEVQENSPASRKPLLETEISTCALLASVIRDSTIQIPSAQFQLMKGDIVIALVQQQNLERVVELFGSPK